MGLVALLLGSLLAAATDRDGRGTMRGEDTIAAVATAAGEASIGVVRISGSKAIAVADRIFRPRRGRPLGERRSHTVVFGQMADVSGLLLDEGLAMLLRGPRSYTGEDTVELHCHGGQIVVRSVLRAVVAAGARVAEPGEFTRRAFLCGRLDLSQAEAVIDVIRAKTDRAARTALVQLGGEMGSLIRRLREQLLGLMAQLEADIDFPELELEVQTREAVAAGCGVVLEEVRRMLSGARPGKLLREGMRVALVGRPNVGKSSLMNRLVREERSIVTEVPGTTRDVVEEWVSIAGIPVVLADTAGIRETAEVIERIGVDRSRAVLERADLVVLVMDACAGVTADDRMIAAGIPPGKPRVGVANKRDLAPEFPLAALQECLGAGEVLAVSALRGQGVEELEAAIARVAGLQETEEALVVNGRQEEALQRSAESLAGALETGAAGFGSDLVSIGIRSAWVALGEVTGETVGEDLLDQIFSRFCIGK